MDQGSHQNHLGVYILYPWPFPFSSFLWFSLSLCPSNISLQLGTHSPSLFSSKPSMNDRSPPHLVYMTILTYHKYTQGIYIFTCCLLQIKLLQDINKTTGKNLKLLFGVWSIFKLAPGGRCALREPATPTSSSSRHHPYQVLLPVISPSLSVDRSNPSWRVLPISLMFLCYRKYIATKFRI